MKLATSTNLLFARNAGSPIHTRDAIRACAEAGFRWLDFGFVEYAQVSDVFHTDSWEKEIFQLRQLAESLGVGFVQAHATLLDFCNPDDGYDEGLALIHRSIRGAAMLGAPWVVVHPSTGVHQGTISSATHRQNVDFFGRLARFAEGCGIGIAVENMWGATRQGVPRYAIQPGQLAQLVDDIGCKNLGACWDTEHGSTENLDQGAALRLLSHRLVATHISDEAGPDCVHVLPYTGFVHWDNVLHALAGIGYDGAFAFEMQHYLRGMPMPLVQPAMQLCLTVGQYMVEQATDLAEKSL